MAPVPCCLTIAGSDPSGGAGIQADLKVFHQAEVYGAAVITLLTVQNTLAVTDVSVVPAEFVRAQLRAVLTDLPIAAAKTGALGSADVIHAVAEELSSIQIPLIVDPVMVSTQGAVLLGADAIIALKAALLPRTFLLTPNLREAELLLDEKIISLKDMERCAIKLLSFGVQAVLVKGGHFEEDAPDLLASEAGVIIFPGKRIDTKHTHGTGCSLSAAITALLARGYKLAEAVEISKKYITEAIRTNPGLGKGRGPINHHVRFDCSSTSARNQCSLSRP